MDLDDSFTERLLQRNKARKQYKNVKENETLEVIAKKRYALVEERQIVEKVEEVSQYSPKRSVEENIDDSPKRQCLEQLKGSPSRQWPQRFRTEDYEKENSPLRGGAVDTFIPFKSSSNVRGLAALKKTSSSESSVSDSEPKSESELSNCRTYVFSTNGSDLCKGRKTRFANLAADINEWEDDSQKSAQVYNNFTSLPSSISNQKFSSNALKVAPTKLQSDVNKKFLTEGTDILAVSPSKKSNSARKDVQKLDVWSQAIEATLEDNSTAMKPDIKCSTHIDDKREYIKKETENNIPVNNIQSRLKMFGHVQTNDDLNKSFEPSELPLSARKALFEKGLHSEGNKLRGQDFEPKLSVAQRAAMFENASQKSSVSKQVSNFKMKNTNQPSALSPTKPSKVANINFNSSPLKSFSTESQFPSEKVKVDSPVHSQSPIKKINTDTHAVEQMLLARVNSKAEVKESTVAIDEKVSKNPLVNYWEKMSGSVNRNSEEELCEKYGATENESEDCYDSGTESKYERETESDFNYEKGTGSDYQETESEMNYEEESEMNYDGESEIELNYDRETESELNYERETDLEFNYNTEVTEDDYSESDAESESTMEENVFKSPKGFPLRSKNQASRSSNIEALTKRTVKFCHENVYNEESCDATSSSDENSYAESSTFSGVISPTDTQLSYASSSSISSSCESESPRESVESLTLSSSSGGNNSDTPLLYTVSFYRKQKQGSRTPPPTVQQTIVRKEQVSTTPSTVRKTAAIQEQIKVYQEEICKQQNIIGQTSQALNLCKSTAEFSGSFEQVEGERLLLIATQKRQALLNEIQRLKAHGAEGCGVPDGMGTLTISDLQLPLKRDFLAAHIEGSTNDAVHWFLCLIRYGAQVIVTQMVSTDDRISNGALNFTNHIKLQNLPPDFSIVFEVYALQTKKEKLPHEKKYHIKRDKSTMRLTPKGKKSDKLMMPTISSPGGPEAVLSPQFGVIGFTRFNISNCSKKCFTLDAVPFLSPLEGVLRVQLHLHAEHKVMEKGFLTMFEDVSGFGAWHRRWCALNAEHLTYWKYPDDEHKKAPIGSLDLKQCITAQVKPVSRDVCARPHTFQLVIMRPQTKGDKNTLISKCSDTITTTKHLLSADTKEERVLWCNKLNEALTTVRKWDPQALQPIDSHQD